MVFDAGSSHTSLFVYQWDSDKENDTGVVSQTLSCDVQGQYPPATGSVVVDLTAGWVTLGWHCRDGGALAVAGGPLSPRPSAPGGTEHRDGQSVIAPPPWSAPSCCPGWRRCHHSDQGHSESMGDMGEEWICGSVRSQGTLEKCLCC